MCVAEDLQSQKVARGEFKSSSWSSLLLLLFGKMLLWGKGKIFFSVTFAFKHHCCKRRKELGNSELTRAHSLLADGLMHSNSNFTRVWQPTCNASKLHSRKSTQAKTISLRHKNHYRHCTVDVRNIDRKVVFCLHFGRKMSDK